MKKNKIGVIVLWIVVILFLLNTMLAYYSYRQASDKKEPRFSFGVIEEDSYTIYKEGVYKIIIEEVDNIRKVSLKLFFIK